MAKIEGSGVPDTNENMKLCICGTCPTFRHSSLSGVIFCARGKAKEKVGQMGCACGNCQLCVTYGLKARYFCLK
jgi:hypothetical protein